MSGINPNLRPVPRRGMNPFCDAPIMSGADVLRGLYDVVFDDKGIIEAYMTWKVLHFAILGVQDVLDARLEIGEAMSVLNTGGLAGLGIALDPITGSAANRVGVSGDMEMRADNSTCHGGKLVFNQNLCYIEINWDDVKRKNIGSRYVYAPRVVMIFYASGYVFTNDLRLAIDAGDCIGAILFPLAFGAITRIYAVSGQGPPVGSPSVEGNLTVKEQYDP